MRTFLSACIALVCVYPLSAFADIEGACAARCHYVNGTLICDQPCGGGSNSSHRERTEQYDPQRNAPPNTYLAVDGKYHPMKGYIFWNRNAYAENDYRVVRIRKGTLHPWFPNVMWANDEGGMLPVDGYYWEDGDNPGRADYRVTLDDKLLQIGDELKPIKGFDWCKRDDKKDFTVCPIPGAAHPSYPNVIWVDKEHHIRPAPGYHWENGQNPGSAGFRVLPLNVIRGSDSRLQAAPGYEWLNDTPGDFRVRPKPGLTEDANGGLRPQAGYHWVHPNDPNDLSVEIQPGLEMRADGKFYPLEGFRWVDPNNQNDSRVVPVAPSERTAAGLENIKRFVATCNRLLADPNTADEQLKLQCGNVQFDGADPNLPPGP